MSANSYKVLFPGLNLSFNINSVAFNFGSITVYWYGIIVCIGIMLAVFYVITNCKRFKVDVNCITDAIIVGILCGIIGARLYYVIFFPGDFYLKNPAKILSINEGGIAIYGGIIGGLAGGLFVARRKKVNLLAVLDLAALGLLIGQGIGRWGNFVNQEAFGSQTDTVFRMMSEKTGNVAVHPCFLYESVWCALGFILLHFFSIKYQKYYGQIFFMYLVWYGLERFFVEHLRTDSLIIPFFNLKVSQFIACVTVAIGIIFLIKFKNKNINDL